MICGTIRQFGSKRSLSITLSSEALMAEWTLIISRGLSRSASVARR